METILTVVLYFLAVILLPFALMSVCGIFLFLLNIIQPSPRRDTE